MDVDSIMSMNCESLRTKLRELGLDSTGLKQVLQNRLLQHFGHNPSAEGEDAESTNSDYCELDAGTSAGARSNGPVFTLKDIAESLSTFSGTDSLNVRSWIEDFEENAETVGWNAIQKFIYAKQLLKGAAKLFVRSQSGLKDWNTLRSALIKEFGETSSAADVHKLLRSRRKNQNETYREYLYVLMEIGKPINLDVASLLDYFVEGIPDSRFNKTILYQARTVEQMKENIKIYEKIRTSFNKENRKQQFSDNTKAIFKEENNGDIKIKKCYKCGNPNHLAKYCKETQFKCFKCNEAGHRASECKVNKPVFRQDCGNVNTLSLNKEPFEPGMLFKKFLLGDIELYGLVDTGCNTCTIRSDIFEKLGGKYKLVPQKECLEGAGASVFYTQGYFEAPVVIDGFSLNLRFEVVRAEDIRYTAVLGNNLLQFVNFFVKKDGVELVPKVTNCVDREKECANTPDEIVEVYDVCLNLERDEDDSEKLKENGQENDGEGGKGRDGLDDGSESKGRSKDNDKDKTDDKNEKQKVTKDVGKTGKDVEIDKKVVGNNKQNKRGKGRDSTIKNANGTDRTGIDHISKTKEENRRNFNEKLNVENNYKINYLVAIKSNQFDDGLKLKRKYYGPYKIICKMKHGQNKVQKIGENKGPKKDIYCGRTYETLGTSIRGEYPVRMAECGMVVKRYHCSECSMVVKPYHCSKYLRESSRFQTRLGQIYFQSSLV